MSLEDFQLIDNEPNDNSIIKRNFLKIYHQQGANINNPDQNIELIFGEINIYQQIGNAYLEFDVSVRKTAGDCIDASNIKLISNAFAYSSKKGTLSTTGSFDLENKFYVGQDIKIMRLLTSKVSYLSSCFDKNEENALNKNNVLKQILFNNHATDVNKGKIKGQLPLERIFGFCKTFKKITKNLGVHITFKTANLQDILYSPQ